MPRAFDILTPGDILASYVWVDLTQFYEDYTAQHITWTQDIAPTS
jgi:hypothetical protein